MNARRVAFIAKSAKADQPFFVWFNTTRMHVFTHLKPESLGKTGKGSVRCALARQH